MSARPWVISVLSTDYDLHEHRQAIITELQKKNVRVSAFELPDFPVEVDIHSHDSCLIALDRIDIALLVIDKRYGGIYIGDSKCSITETEYLTVVKSKKPCLVFVSKQAWDEWHTYKVGLKSWTDTHPYTQEEKNNWMPKTEFDGQYECKYVETIQIFSFIDTVQKAYKKFGVSNWIDQYTDKADLLVKIDGKLKGLSRFLLECLVKEQKKKLGNRHTSTGLGLSLSDVFSRGYYLEPSFDEESGKLESGKTLDIKIKRTLENDNSILVYGEAGYGKTTILAKSFLSHVKAFLQKGSYQIPFYLWLKEKNSKYHFDFLTYINESFVDDWKREPYPYLNLKDIQPYFYFDGFDEIGEKMTPDEVVKISRSDIFTYPILLTCRQQFAFRYVNTANFSDRFGVRVKINTWQPEKAQEYISNFCRINNKDEKFSATVCKLLADNQELRDVLNSPLLITMLLWIVEQNRMRIPETVRTRIELFKSCVAELAKRELRRLGQSETCVSDLVVVWSYAAWEVYYCKLKNKTVRFDILIPLLKKNLPLIQLNYTEAHFEALFDSSEKEIFGTFHEQFLEFLVANTIYLACSDGKYPYPEFLSFVLRPEINRYFRAIWREATADEQNKIITNLNHQYLSNLGDDSFESVSKRVHAVYHIGRFDIPQRESLITKAFNQETHISVFLSLFFGAVKMGKLDYEQQFFERLTTDNAYNEANRGYHLAYYSDTIMGDKLPFNDDIQKKWTGTLRAFLRHFHNEDVEHYYLRRIDLVTMKHFIEARGFVEPLTDDIMNELAKLIDSSSYAKEYVSFQNKINAAFDDLKAVVSRLPLSQTVETVL